MIISEIDKAIIQVLKDGEVIAGMIAPFFNGNEEKMANWYFTNNPLLGGLSPAEMVALGKTEKLKKLIQNVLEENER